MDMKLKALIPVVENIRESENPDKCVMTSCVSSTHILYMRENDLMDHLSQSDAILEALNNTTSAIECLSKQPISAGMMRLLNSDGGLDQVVGRSLKYDHENRDELTKVCVEGLMTHLVTFKNWIVKWFKIIVDKIRSWIAAFIEWFKNYRKVLNKLLDVVANPNSEFVIPKDRKDSSPNIFTKEQFNELSKLANECQHWDGKEGFISYSSTDKNDTRMDKIKVDEYLKTLKDKFSNIKSGNTVIPMSREDTKKVLYSALNMLKFVEDHTRIIRILKKEESDLIREIERSTNAGSSELKQMIENAQAIARARVSFSTLRVAVLRKYIIEAIRVGSHYKIKTIKAN